LRAKLDEPRRREKRRSAILVFRHPLEADVAAGAFFLEIGKTGCVLLPAVLPTANLWIIEFS
jgi:hypothetical protein